MTLAAGTVLGHYRIVAPIGAGGMGEVYRATDTKLGREVAIKTLPAMLASDEARLARFEREARLLATLNHAHIAAIYGLDEHEGARFLAMELIEGETLEQKLKRGALPTDEALRIALQVAGALEAAHEKGVIHRDLKPANIMLTRDGVAKVLDFGLAKAFVGDPQEASPAHSPALSQAMTQQGLILGTAGYMSPEQASGQATDQRADIWAFGVVLFEMLSGLPLFAGESVPHVLADVLRTEPDWKRLPKTLHPRLKLLLERCLVKKARNRYHSIADVRVDLESVLADPLGIERSPAAFAGGAPQSAARRAMTGLTLAAAGAAAAAVAAWLLWPPPAPRPVTRLTYDVESLTGALFAAIDRGGTRVAWVAGSPPAIHVLDLDEFEARPIPDTVGNATLPPCFSPDGEWIAYYADNGTALRRVLVAGGRGVTMVEGLQAQATCDWADDGYIYFVMASSAGGGIRRVAASASGAAVETVTELLEGEVLHAAPQLLPDGATLLFSAVTSIETGGINIVLLDLATRERTAVLEGAGFAYFVPDSGDGQMGHLVFGQDGALFAAPFDLRSRRLGDRTPLLEGLMSLGPFTIPGVSTSGTLAYLAGESAANIGVLLSHFDRDGAEERLPARSDMFGGVMLAQDGERFVTDVFDLDRLIIDVWIYEIQGGRLSRLIADDELNVDYSAVWTPDDQRVIFGSAENVASMNSRVRIAPADASSPPVTLASFPDGIAFPSSVNPDGTALIGTMTRTGDNGDIWALPLDAGPAAADGELPIRWLVQSGAAERHASFSHDGRWIAYSSDESGRDEIYVIPFPGLRGRIPVSVGGGRQPRWNPRGGELFYLSGGSVMAVSYEANETSFRPGTPVVLFDDPAAGAQIGNGNSFQYDVGPDGQRLLMLRPGGAAGERAELRVVRNWTEELRVQAPFSSLP